MLTIVLSIIYLLKNEWFLRYIRILFFEIKPNFSNIENSPFLQYDLRFSLTPQYAYVILEQPLHIFFFIEIRSLKIE